MDYPHLVPVPIKTKGLPFWKAIWHALTTSRQYRLIEDYQFTLNNTTYIIPKGFIFDGASIPRVLWPILSPTGVLMIPGLLHDFGYKYDCMITIDGLVEDPGKVWLDKLFRDVGKEVNGLFSIDGVAYWALRGFGYVAWLKHRRADAQLSIDFPAYLTPGVATD